jgi:hypothetical protein
MSRGEWRQRGKALEFDIFGVERLGLWKGAENVVMRQVEG